MAISAGALSVSLGLDADGYIKGFTRAEDQARKFANNFAKSMKESSRDVSASMEFVKGALQGVIAAFSVKLFLDFSKGIIDANDHLFDLSQRTGATVEELNGLGYAFKLSGASAEAFEKGMQALNKAISEAGSNQTGDKANLFRSLGLAEAAKGAGTAAQALEKLADVFPRLSEADRAAVSTELLRDRMGELIPGLLGGAEALRALSDEGRRLNPVTTEAAKLANEFNDQMDNLGRSIKGSALPAINAILPVLNKFLIGLAEGQRLGLSFRESLTFDVDTSQLSRLREELDKFIGAQNIATRAINLFRGGTDAIIAEKKREIEALEKLNEERLASIRAVDRAEANAAQPRLRVPTKTNVAKAAIDDPTRKILEGQLKALERTIKEEQDLLRDRESFLQSYYQDDKIGIKEYFTTRQDIIGSSLNVEIAAFDRQIALLEAHRDRLDKAGKPLTSAKDRADAENKIAEAIDKRAKAQQDAATKGVRLWLDETKALQSFTDKVEGLALQLAELSDSPIVVAARFDFDNKGLNEFIALQQKSTDEDVRRQADSAARFQTGIRDRIIQQDKLNRATDAYSLTLDKLGLAQDRISIAESSGSITGLDALRQRTAVNESYIVVLQKELAVLEAIAIASGKPQDLVNVERLRVQLEGLVAQGDLVAKKFSNIFEGGFSDALTSAIDGTKSLKDAFKDMERSIVQSINRIASEELAKKLFGSGGFLGSGGSGFDIGGFFSKLFGGAFASGGMPPIGKLSLVGERGPELFVPKVAGTIVPNNALGGTVNNVFNIRVPENMSALTRSQMLRDIGESTSRAMRRDG